jgi:hypothetical protein
MSSEQKYQFKVVSASSSQEAGNAKDVHTNELADLIPILSFKLNCIRYCSVMKIK